MNIDVCLVTETFLRPTVPDTYVTIDGFRFFRRDRKICRCRQKECVQPHNGGGVMIYVRSSYQCDIFDCAPDSESLWIKLSSIHSPEPLFVNVTYHPPGSNPKPTVDYLYNSLLRISTQHPRSRIVLGGDFNRISLSDLEIDFCLTVLDTPPTRADATLDLLLTNRPDLVLNTSCFVPSLKSDHRAVLMRPRCRIPPVRYKVEFTDYNFQGFQKLNTILESTSFSQVYSEIDIDAAADILDRTISKCVAAAFPTKIVTMSDRDPAWITPKAKWLLHRKKKAKTHGSLQKVNQLSNRLKSIKLKFFQQHKSKVLWNEVDSISHRKHCNKSIHYEAFDSHQLNIDLADRSALPSDSTRLSAPVYDKSDQLPPVLTLSEVAMVMKKSQTHFLWAQPDPFLRFY